MNRQSGEYCIQYPVYIQINVVYTISGTNRYYRKPLVHMERGSLHLVFEKLLNRSPGDKRENSATISYMDACYAAAIEGKSSSASCLSSDVLESRLILAMQAFGACSLA
jgi:hypothetical protein